MTFVGFCGLEGLYALQRALRHSRGFVTFNRLWCLQWALWPSVSSVSFNRFFGPEVVSWPSMALRPSTGFAAFKSFVDYKVFCALLCSLQLVLSVECGFAKMSLLIGRRTVRNYIATVEVSKLELD